MKTEYWNDTILIRPYRESDIDSLFEAARESIAEVFPWGAWCHHNYTREESQSWVLNSIKSWDEGTAFSFVITDLHSGAYLGGCGLNNILHEYKLANLGYWVRTSCTGRGFATAATRLVARFGFENLGLERIEIIASVENSASRKVAKKAGAVEEGILRRRLHYHGVAHDAASHSLLREEILGV